MLEIKDLKVNYGAIPALRGISLNVDAGEIVALVGANGAGKSTVLRTISGLKRPISGSIKFLDEELIKTQPYNIVGKGVVQVPEGRGIFPNLSVAENMFIGGYLRKDKEQLEKDTKIAYDVFPVLFERKKQAAGTLSGGELQMLAIARALVMNPKLLLLDEPSMGLAPILVNEIFKKIKQLNEEKGVTVLLVEQNAQKALEVSHKAYVMETGEITIAGKSSELLQNDTVKKAYLGI